MDCGSSPPWAKTVKGALFVELKMKTKPIKSQSALTIQKNVNEKNIPP